MKILLVLTTMIMSFFLVAPAQADVHHSHYRHSYHAKTNSHHYEHTRYHIKHRYYHPKYKHHYNRKSRTLHVYAHLGHRYNRIGGRPAKWCGWFMRTIFGGGPEYNVAANWRHRGSPTSPHAGAIVVWPHHVGLITGHANGRWIVKSGNWGGRVATVPMSLRGAIAFRNP